MATFLFLIGLETEIQLSFWEYGNRFIIQLLKWSNSTTLKCRSDWLRNRNAVEFLGIWESVYNPAFNYGEFAIIKRQAGLNN